MLAFILLIASLGEVRPEDVPIVPVKNGWLEINHMAMSPYDEETPWKSSWMHQMILWRDCEDGQSHVVAWRMMAQYDKKYTPEEQELIVAFVQKHCLKFKTPVPEVFFGPTVGHDKLGLVSKNADRPGYKVLWPSANGSLCWVYVDAVKESFTDFDPELADKQTENGSKEFRLNLHELVTPKD